MQPLRRFFVIHRALTGALIAFALAMKVLLPAGFMPIVSEGHFVVTLCSGSERTTMVLAVPGTKHESPVDGRHGKTDQPCTYSGLSAPSLSAADPALLALVFLFVATLALYSSARPVAVEPPFLRPPLRGPPAGR